MTAYQLCQIIVNNLAILIWKNCALWETSDI